MEPTSPAKPPAPQAAAPGGAGRFVTAVCIPPGPGLLTQSEQSPPRATHWPLFDSVREEQTLNLLVFM